MKWTVCIGAIFGASITLALMFPMPSVSDPDDSPAAASWSIPAAGGASRHSTEFFDRLDARMSARPLFSPARRPQAADSGHVTARPAPPRLSGVMCWPDGSFAIFQPDQDAHAFTVGEGAVVGEWTVETITTDGVTVRRGDERLVLRLAFAVRPAEADPAPGPEITRARDQWGRHVQPPSFLERRARSGTGAT